MSSSKEENDTTINDRTTTPISTSSAEEEVTFFHDFIAGGIAGSASVIVGHPFDTIKVRLQTGTSATSSGGLFSSFFSPSGFRSLYRGLSAPLSTACVVNAIVFSSYGASSRVYDNFIGTQQEQQGDDAPAHDPWQKSFLCGCFAGAVQCLVICPMEHLKCRLQIQGKSAGGSVMYKGPIHAAEQIVRNHGFFDGLFRGWNVTCLREIPAFGAYFCVYDWIKDTIQATLLERQRSRIEQRIQNSNTYMTVQQIQQLFQDEEDDFAHSRLLLSSITAGGLSGCLTWLMVYPVDVIKSRIQTNPLGSHHPSHRNMIPVAQSIISQQGWKYLFRGVGVTMLRAFPVNGTVFPVYEFTLMYISNLQYDNNNVDHHHY